MINSFSYTDPMTRFRLESARGLDKSPLIPSIDRYNHAIKTGELKNAIPIGGDDDKLPEVKARTNGEKVNINIGNENSVTKTTSLKPFDDEKPAMLNAGNKKKTSKSFDPKPRIVRAAKSKKSAPTKKNTKKSVPATKKAAAPKKSAAKSTPKTTTKKLAKNKAK